MLTLRAIAFNRKNMKEVCAAQFAPSSVYYLLEVYTNRHVYSFPYHKSVDEVKKEAKLRWRVR
jgi:hypothetical protein